MTAFLYYPSGALSDYQVVERLRTGFCAIGPGGLESYDEWARSRLTREFEEGSRVGEAGDSPDQLMTRLVEANFASLADYLEACAP